MKHLLVATAFAGAFGAAAPAFATEGHGCSKNCGGTTQPTQPTTPSVTNTVGVVNNTDIKVPVTIGVEAGGGDGGSVNLAPGAVQGGGGGSVGDINNASRATASTGPVTQIGGSQSLTVKQVRQAPPAVGPAMPPQAGVAIVGGGKLNDQSAIILCAQAPKSGSIWSFGLSTPVGGVSVGKTPGVQGIDNVWEQKVITDENGVEKTVLVNSQCLAGIQAEQGVGRVYGSGPSGAAVVVATDIIKNPDLQKGVAEVRPYKNCADPVAAVINGGCEDKTQGVSENVNNFGVAAQGVPQQEVCPTGTKRAGLPPLWNAQIGKPVCGL